MVSFDINLVSGTVVHGSQVLAGLVALAAVVIWPGRSAWRRQWSAIGTALLRLLTLGLVLVTTLVATALTLNVKLGPVVQNFSDIGPLFQTQPDPGTDEPGVPVRAGGLAHFHVRGPLSHYDGDVDVWTPPGYNSRLRSKDYPVLVAMHGWPGDPRFLETHLPLMGDVQKLASTKKMAWPIVLMPNWSKDASGTVRDTECTNGAPNLQLETWLTKDLPIWMKANFHVKTGSENWAVYGYSAGAFCARMMAMLHPNVFGAAIDLSGYSRPDFSRGYVPFTPTSPQGQRYDLISKVQLDAPHVSLYIANDPKDTSVVEGSSYPSSLAFKQAAGAHSATRITWVETKGGHSVALWNPQTKLGLAWLGHTLKGFKA